MIKIITDSTRENPSELQEKQNIRVVPVNIIWNNQQFPDRWTLNPEHFFVRIENEPLRRTYKGLAEGLCNKFVNSLGSQKKLAQRVREALLPVELLVQLSGPVLGNNTGPGAPALRGYAAT